MRAVLLSILFLNAPLVFAKAESAPAIDTTRITVSGISAGAQMAHQLHIAYSDLISGAALIAGGPYGCAGGSLATAMARCIGKSNGPLPVAEFTAAIRAAANRGEIADIANLADDRVWLFHGALDTVVAAEVSAAAGMVYADFIPGAQIARVDDVQAGHNFPAKGRGSPCADSKPPFVGDCDYDAAGEILQYLYPELQAPTAEPVHELQQVPLADAAAAALSESAYLFVPADCKLDSAQCSLHLVLHGCAQSAITVGTEFIEQSGYLPWAAANKIILAFPQVMPSAVNPLGCWDWWGYTGANYMHRSGPQMRTLATWLQSLAAGSTK